MRWIWLLAAAAYGQPCCQIEILVRDSAGTALEDARVVAVSPEAQLETKTAKEGRARLRVPAARTYRLAAGKDGYVPLERDVEVLARTEVEFVLEKVQTQSVDVTSAAPGVAESATGREVTGEQLRWSGADPSRLRDALPLIPGINRSPEGRLQISGGPEHRAALLLNSVDATDPVTGRFGATVPIDSVATLNVYRSPFLAEFGKFSTSVVSVEARKGGEKWHWELNDPTPEMRIRSARVVGVRGFTPRLNFNGPLVRNKLYFAQSLEYALRKVPTFTQPFPRNEEKQESWNGLTQFDAAPNARHFVTLQLHGVPQRINHVKPGFYNALPATPGWRGHEYRGSLSDKWALGTSLIESTVSYAETRGRVAPQGDLPYVLHPTFNEGNYFARNERMGNRAQWTETVTLAPVNARGTHHIKIGSIAVRTRVGGEYHFRPITIAAFETLRFRNLGPYAVNDWEAGGFAQDHWVISPSVSLDYGVRADWQKVTTAARAAPRAGLSWSLFGDPATVLRIGYGWFYDRVPLAAYGFDRWPVREGFTNILPQRRLVPKTQTWNLSLDRRLSQFFHVRAGYQESRSSGLIVLQPIERRIELRGEGRAAYRQLELLTRLRYKPNQEILVSYVRAFNRGNLNDFSEFLGDFPAPILRPDFRVEMTGNIPHRLLIWGDVPFTRKRNWRIAPVIEYRTGFPWSALNAQQQYAEPPNSRRYPNFLSIDFRLARDLVWKDRKFRISFAMFNVTNHWNPDSVRVNTADGLFGQFLGHHARRYRLDFDLLN
ncbi:MAG: hypothetical protein FJW30_09930 [Acidobacteria bacterium]|nr:hypothetical protein [Acidobacteriota bacterium]